MSRKVNGHEILIEERDGRHRVLVNEVPIRFTWRRETAEKAADEIQHALRKGEDSVINDSRREQVYKATNRILEYAQGDSDEALHKVEDAVDTILSTVGVPDRVVEE